MMRSHRQAWIWVLLAAAQFPGTAGLRAGDWGHRHGCNEACQPACGKCVPVPDVRKETRVLYRCKASDICLPHRSLWDLFRGHGRSCVPCGGGGACHSCPAETCPQCECRPRRKMVLLKKIVSVECPTFKCEADGLPGQCSALQMYEPSLPDAPAPPLPPPASPGSTRSKR